MPTTNFTTASPGFTFSGWWADNGGYWDGKQASRFDFVATGTSCTINCVAGATVTVTVRVDGSVVSFTVPTGSFSQATVFSGLADTAHTVSLVIGAINGFDISKTTSVVITGAAPALGAPAGFGPQYRLNPQPRYVRAEGYALYTTPSATPVLNASRTDALLTFRATCTSIQIWVAQVVPTFRLLIDGVDTGQYSVPLSANLYGWVQIGTGLDGATEHEYSILACNTSPTVAAWIYTVMTIGGTMNTTTAYAPRPIWAFYGDSITECHTGTNGDSSLGWPHLLCRGRGVNAVNRGLSGTYVSSTQANGNYGEVRVTDITALSPTPSVVFVLYGANDVASGSEKWPVWQAAYLNMMTQLVAALPAAQFYCLGITDSTGVTVATMAAFNAVIQVIVANFHTPLVRYISTVGWVQPANFTAGVHPDPQGNIDIVTHLQQYLARTRSLTGESILRLGGA